MRLDHLYKRYWEAPSARGYFAVVVGNVNAEEIQKYIEQQKEHRKMILDF